MNRAVRVVTKAIVLAAGLSSCGGSTEPAGPPAAVSTYLDVILNLMQAHSVHRFQVNWTDFRAQVTQAASSAQSIPDLYPAISLALKLLGDHHSYYIKPNGGLVTQPGFLAGCLIPPVSSPVVPPDIGYIRIAAFSGTVQESWDRAAQIQASIAARDTDGLVGWIVDVRGNTGGNMWPMLAGVGPVLGTGISGHFVFPDSTRQDWGYFSEGSKLDGFVQVPIAAPYVLKRTNPAVAVLTDGATISSGEAMVVAFNGRARTRRFGAPTCGLPTSNATFSLSDGAQLILTEGNMEDRNLVRYDSVIAPDEVFADSAATVQRAIQWLRSVGP